MDFTDCSVHLLRVKPNSKTVKLQAKLYFSYHSTQFHSSVYAVTVTISINS